MRRLGVVTGLAFEAECLSGPDRDLGLLVRVAGASARRAQQESEFLLAAGCDSLLSFGIAGGLDPELGPGAIVVASSVVGPDGRRHPAASAWADRLVARLGREAGARLGALAGSDRLVAGPEEKGRLRVATGALAVDMESHGVAAAAEAAGVPFTALRAVADAADASLPEWMSEAVAPDGSVRRLMVAGRLFLKPWEAWSLIRLGRANARAGASLRRAVLLLGRELLA